MGKMVIAAVCMMPSHVIWVTSVRELSLLKFKIGYLLLRTFLFGPEFDYINDVIE